MIVFSSCVEQMLAIGKEEDRFWVCRESDGVDLLEFLRRGERV